MNEWAIARVALGLSEDEFWHLQPRQWNALIWAWHNKERRIDARIGRICAVIANCNRAKDSPIFEVEDFMPGEEGRERPTKSPEELLQTAIALHAAHGGTIDG